MPSIGQQNRKSFVIRVMIISALVAGLVAGVVMYIALDHNPMGEYCEFIENPHAHGECIIQWRHLLSLGGITFLWASILTGSLLTIILFTLRLFRKNSSKLK